MLLLCSSGAAGKCSIKFTSPIQPVFSSSGINPRRNFVSKRNSRKRLNLTAAKAEGGVDSSSATKPSSSGPPTAPPSPLNSENTVFVGQEGVPLEGVIQFDKPKSSSNLDKWGRVALLSGGDVLALLIFSAIGRYNHGLPLFDLATLRTADPFIAGWFLSAYFVGGYAEDGRGMNGVSKAVLAAAKSWAVGIPLGFVIRTAGLGNLPPPEFILVTLGSTAVLLIGWRTLLFNIFPNNTNKKNDAYRQGSPFELFELLTSLIRRW